MHAWFNVCPLLRSSLLAFNSHLSLSCWSKEMAILYRNLWSTPVQQSLALFNSHFCQRRKTKIHWFWWYFFSYTHTLISTAFLSRRKCFHGEFFSFFQVLGLGKLIKISIPIDEISESNHYFHKLVEQMSSINSFWVLLTLLMKKYIKFLKSFL